MVLRKVLIILACLMSIFLCTFTTVQSYSTCEDSIACEHCHYIEETTIQDHHLLLAYNGYTYTNVCWRCHSSINSNVNSRCSRCGWYICKNCGACESTCSRCPSWSGSGSSSSSSKKSDNSWIWILVVAGIGIGGFYLYKKNQK